jgi:hypothetical protein
MHQIHDRYKVEENILTVGDSEIKFDYPIQEVLEISNMLIVRIKKPIGIIFNENVFGVSLTERKVKWQIAKLKYGSEVYCPFVGMKYYNNQLYLNNWCDIYLIVDPLTGEILERSLPAKS